MDDGDDKQDFAFTAPLLKDMPSNPVYGTFNGFIDANSTGRLFGALSNATASFTELHLVFQSHGGIVSDGIALYNLFRSLPIPLHIYNIGGVMSAGVIAYLGAHHRYASAHASFMIHKASTGQISAANSGALKGITRSIALDDDRMTSIIDDNLTLKRRTRIEYNQHDIFLSPEEAVACGLAHEIREFSIPKGVKLNFI